MFQVTFKLGGQNLTLKTNDRKVARYTCMFFKENKVPCEVTEELKPREVKFKGLE